MLIDDAESLFGGGQEYSRHEYGRFIELAKSEQAAGRTRAAETLQRCAEAFMFHPRAFEAGIGKSYFGPAMTAGDQQRPAWDEMAAPTIALYRQRTRKSKNVFARARYADILWEKDRDHQFARIAFSGYLEIGRVYIARGWFRQASEAFGRTLTIAVNLNDPGLVQTSLFMVCSSVTRCRQSQTSDDVQLLGALAGLPRKFMTDALLQWAEINASERADHFSGEGGEALWTERTYLDLTGQFIRRRRMSDIDIRRRVANSLKRHGLEHHSPLVGASFLRDAISAFRQLGDGAEVQHLLIEFQRMSNEASKEYGVVESRVTVPTANVEEYIASFVVPGHLTDSLLRVATSLQPDLATARKLAEQLKASHPLQYLIPSQTISHDGRVVGQATTEEEIFEHQVMRLFRLHYHMGATLIAQIFERLASHELNPVSLTEFLCEGAIIGSDRKEFIQHGMKKYFERDWASAIHLLVPQLEHILRSILPFLGVATTQQDERGLHRVLSLDAVLRQEGIRALLGESLWTYFYAVLSDEGAENIRNDVAHGLIPWEQCDETRAALLVHLLVILRLIDRQSAAEKVG